MTPVFAHSMPFGAEYRGRDTRFRLWAPGVRALDLRLKRDDRRLAMQPAGNGWFELTTEAGPGDEYMFELPDGMRVPDPASRRQSHDVHDPSVVVDPRQYVWRHSEWRGRPWHEAVIYELHVGTVSPEGNFEGVQRLLPRLVDLGVTAIELMPVSDFPGRWNWGYDGVLPYAPDARYGTPEQLKALIDAAHGHGLMVLLDVVYNHFGPDGNYLPVYAPPFFTDRRKTPWGAAIDYSQRPVRDFAIHNAVYWIEEYRFDGLRLDAVHEIIDDSETHVLVELARAVREAAGPDRHVHLVLENDENQARLLARDAVNKPRHFTAQWNDDFHHTAHLVATGEGGGYYADFDQPLAQFGRTLAEGFAFQGEHSDFRKRPRGEPSADLPPGAFVAFLQNHDQVGNRAFGERMAELTEPAALRAITAVLLLAPSIPLLFMGEEFASRQPFCFFSDFEGELGDAVREGRRREFAHYPHFSDPEAREKIPDPQAEETYRLSTLAEPGDAESRSWLQHYRDLLALRRREIVPLLPRIVAGGGRYKLDGGRLAVSWQIDDGARLALLANLCAETVAAGRPQGGRLIWATSDVSGSRLPPWFVAWSLHDAPAS